MKRIVLLTGGVIGLVVLLVAFAKGSPASRAWPAFVLFKKPGEQRVVLVRHPPSRLNTGTHDSIVMLYELSPASDSQVRHLHPGVYLEAYEFEGPRWLGYTDDSVGTPFKLPRLEEATYVSWIWRDTVTNALVWEKPRGWVNEPSKYVLSERARGVMRGIGLLPDRAR